ncbi:MULTISPECIES: type II toxin-antitoxin system PemK/MazF family toxin [Halorubrum]|uniref:Growth inhibitor PemK n=1 Tax=Halorubrum tropicale TaxID=1765655 RepID=A0A0N0BSG2_9EURY|nr:MULTISPECIES: type II toxin-antitoxin system PemK/MazF family toxin [Halorubrum]KOX98194.1 growth inhibitor PemK [Halorubrum tropicale]TKX42694.1 type II toxin-antitoxin system PemK/MazF family toxin [Halorubrum sp. ARQ200]TKX51392.1 type II toxin-antitoxin system PemK/MazF family toxin [Halorubrum sp. ASP121]TKX58367.1 type II toxin-antitoxin system PemK/MazF family toxin [Halorubrum sp. ASP1]
MSDGTDVRRGDVVIVRLDPAEGQGMKKTRPAVVVQNDIGNRNSSTTIVAPVTGTYRDYPFEVFVEADGSPLEKNSSVRLDQLRTVSVPERVHSVVGSLDGPTMAEVDEALQLSLGLD